MNGMNNEKERKTILNIDKVITETRFKKKHNGRAYRKIDSVGTDREGGVINKVTTEILLDACDEPITSKEEISGNCKVCGRIIKKHNSVRCDGRCGELMDLRCYQRQGGHVLHGRRFCRFDYWITKFFWQIISSVLRREKRGVSNEEERYFAHPAAWLGRRPVRGSGDLWASHKTE